MSVKRYHPSHPHIDGRDVVLASDYDRDVRALEALSVRRIMLEVAPGCDGMGEEVYAKSVADVERLLSVMGEQIETLTAERDQLAADNKRLRDLLMRVQVSLSLDDTEWGHSDAEKYTLLADVKAELSSAKEVG